MNKFGVILGVAAVATLAGCKDPDYAHEADTSSQGDVKVVDTTPAPAPSDTKAADTPAPAPKCTCLPGTKHTEPCKCGDPNCKCVVETRPVITADVSKPVEPETTVYIVQRGDYLAKISKKFNVTISSIKRLNPSIKGDNKIRIGQKIKLPGKVDVGVQTAPDKASAAKPVAKKAVSSSAYTGATKEYVVKSGDTLGSIAYGNGINIRQLKALNNLTSDSLKIGQKLKIPAEKVVKKADKAAAAVKPVEKAAEKPVEKAAEPAAEAAAPATDAAAPAAPATDAAAPAAPATDAAAPAAPVAKEAKPATMTYVVAEGEDMTAVCIRWNVTAAEIRALNNLADGAQLTAGQIIKLPADAQQ